MPAAAASHPAAITIRALPGSRHPKTSIPVAPAAASSASPQYSSHRPATAAGDGAEPVGGEPPLRGRGNARGGLDPDAEGEGAASDVPIHLRHRAPVDRVHTVGETGQPHPQLPRVAGRHGGLADPGQGLARGIQQGDRGQAGLGCLGEIEQHHVRRTWQRRASRRIRPFQQGVRVRGRSEDTDPGQREDGDQQYRPQ